MTDQRRRSGNDESLINDPEFPWIGGRPYDVLNQRLLANSEPPIGPLSSNREIGDAGFGLRGASAAERKAWDQLKLPQERIVIDFFHYPLPDVHIEDLDPSSLERPMPVAEPDLLLLADCKTEMNLTEPPAQLDFQEIPLASVTDLGVNGFIPSPVCQNPPALKELIEVDDDDK